MASPSEVPCRSAALYLEVFSCCLTFSIFTFFFVSTSSLTLQNYPTVFGIFRTRCARISSGKILAVRLLTRCSGNC